MDIIITHYFQRVMASPERKVSALSLGIDYRYKYATLRDLLKDTTE
jgi:hypothetical protein